MGLGSTLYLSFSVSVCLCLCIYLFVSLRLSHYRHQMISFQKIYGLYGLKHHTVKINGDVTMETNKQTNKQQGNIELPSQWTGHCETEFRNDLFWSHGSLMMIDRLTEKERHNTNILAWVLIKQPWVEYGGLLKVMRGSTNTATPPEGHHPSYGTHGCCRLHL